MKTNAADDSRTYARVPVDPQTRDRLRVAKADRVVSTTYDSLLNDLLDASDTLDLTMVHPDLVDAFETLRDHVESLDEEYALDEPFVAFLLTAGRAELLRRMDRASDDPEWDAASPDSETMEAVFDDDWL